MNNVISVAGKCISGIDDLEVAYEQEYPEKMPVLKSPDSLELDPRLRQYLDQEYADGLFAHQHAALVEIFSGRHTVVSTATSSGKSLTFMVPVFQAYLENPQSTCLFLYPQKALANDQLEKLRRMYEIIVGKAPPLELLARYDGATPQDIKPAIRERGQFILSNPDMLHYALLQYHERHWSNFFSKLKYVIIDEAHAYRGIFGSSVAYILRRLRCVCQRYGAEPLFISASATIDQPGIHLKRLTGLEFIEIGPEQDGSKQGAKQLKLITSPRHHYQVGRDLMVALVESHLSCLTFCPSRTSAERLLSDLPVRELEKGAIRVYRSGLSPSEREEIENGIKSGSVRGVFSTSALELGIDIGELDVVLCVGLPNTMMSLWQRAGRVGRSGKEGAVLFVTADRPLDTYFTQHPSELFERSNEPLALSLHNRRLVCHHLACAIQEAGDEDALDTNVLGEDIENALNLKRNGRLSAEIFYSDDPHMQTPIRSGDTRNYKIIVDGENEVGEIDPWHMLREAYPKAIYLHGGRRFRVLDILRGKSEIRVDWERSANLTTPYILKGIRMPQVFAVSSYPSAVIKKGQFEVTERLTQITEKNRSGETVRQYMGSQGLQPHRLRTEGVSIETLPELTNRIDKATRRSNRRSVMRAIERLIGGLFPVISGPCDVMDYGTYSESRGDRVLWYLYDQVYGGIGLTIQVYERFADLLAKALNGIQACNCEEDTGCFRCVRDPDKEDIASKADCIAVLKLVCDELQTTTPKHEVFNVDTLADIETGVKCQKCDAMVEPDANFCKSCGERVIIS
jgi:DEAD/DEAH box helicase domain-containing protein